MLARGGTGRDVFLQAHWEADGERSAAAQPEGPERPRGGGDGRSPRRRRGGSRALPSDDSDDEDVAPQRGRQIRSPAWAGGRRSARLDMAADESPERPPVWRRVDTAGKRSRALSASVGRLAPRLSGSPVRDEPAAGDLDRQSGSVVRGGGAARTGRRSPEPEDAGGHGSAAFRVTLRSDWGGSMPRRRGRQPTAADAPRLISGRLAMQSQTLVSSSPDLSQELGSRGRLDLFAPRDDERASPRVSRRDLDEILERAARRREQRLVGRPPVSARDLFAAAASGRRRAADASAGVVVGADEPGRARRDSGSSDMSVAVSVCSSKSSRSGADATAPERESLSTRHERLRAGRFGSETGSDGGRSAPAAASPEPADAPAAARRPPVQRRRQWAGAPAAPQPEPAARAISDRLARQSQACVLSSPDLSRPDGQPPADQTPATWRIRLRRVRAGAGAEETTPAASPEVTNGLQDGPAADCVSQEAAEDTYTSSGRPSGAAIVASCHVADSPALRDVEERPQDVSWSRRHQVLGSADSKRIADLGSNEVDDTVRSPKFCERRPYTLNVPAAAGAGDGTDLALADTGSPGLAEPSHQATSVVSAAAVAVTAAESPCPSTTACVSTSALSDWSGSTAPSNKPVVIAASVPADNARSPPAVGTSPATPNTPAEVPSDSATPSAGGAARPRGQLRRTVSQTSRSPDRLSTGTPWRSRSRSPARCRIATLRLKPRRVSQSPDPLGRVAAASHSASDVRDAVDASTVDSWRLPLPTRVAPRPGETWLPQPWVGGSPEPEPASASAPTPTRPPRRRKSRHDDDPPPGKHRVDENRNRIGPSSSSASGDSRSDSTSPTDDTPDPADDTPDPADGTPDPADDTPDPADDTPDPADDTPDPADDTPDPADDTPDPAVEVTADTAAEAQLETRWTPAEVSGGQSGTDTRSGAAAGESGPVDLSGFLCRSALDADELDSLSGFSSLASLDLELELDAQLESTQQDAPAVLRKQSTVQQNLIAFPPDQIGEKAASAAGEVELAPASAAPQPLAVPQTAPASQSAPVANSRTTVVPLEGEVLKRELTIQGLKAELAGAHEQVVQSQVSQKKLVKMVDAYSLALTRLSSDTELQRHQQTEGTRKLKSDRDEAREEVANIEAMFADLHRKYEKSKGFIHEHLRLADSLSTSWEEAKQQVSREKQRYDMLQKYAEDSMQRLRSEMEIAVKTQETEVLRVSARLQLSENRATKLERENKEVAAICDELIQKMGGPR